MTCATCANCDATTYAVPVCRKAGQPNACVLVRRRVDNADGKCPHWCKR